MSVPRSSKICQPVKMFLIQEFSEYCHLYAITPWTPLNTILRCQKQNIPVIVNLTCLSKSQSLQDCAIHTTYSGENSKRKKKKAPLHYHNKFPATRKAAMTTPNDNEKHPLMVVESKVLCSPNILKINIREIFLVVFWWSNWSIRVECSTKLCNKYKYK